MNNPRRRKLRPDSRSVEDVGKGVQYWREKRGVALPVLAERIGVSAEQLRNVEMGQDDPDLDLLDALSKELLVPLIKLLSINGEE